MARPGRRHSAEIPAGTGYDWLLVDGEHAPNDLRSILHQLQAIASATSALPPGAQPPTRRTGASGDTALIKQFLDLGVQTLLVPMVDTAEQARQLVRATRYAPEGVRGMGSALARLVALAGVPAVRARPTSRSACWCRPRRWKP